MSETNSQRERILKHLEAGNKITALEGLKMFESWGGFRTRMSEIKKQLDSENNGRKLDSEFIKLESGKKVKQYFITHTPTQTKLNF